MGVGFLSSIWNDFKDGVIDKEDKKERNKLKKKADKYAKDYTKNMEKKLSSGMSLRDALAAEKDSNKKNSSKGVNPLHTKIK